MSLCLGGERSSNSLKPKKMKKLIPLIIIIFLTTSSFAQHYSKYTNHWYFFKDAGLDFLNYSPVFDTTGALKHSNTGCSSVISDYSGNLLFYSDGYYVYNKNHNQMPNGFGLKGGIIGAGGVQLGSPNIIFPKPGDSTLYYHFLPVGQPISCDTTAYYSLIDISADSGKGDVILKNIPFMSSSTTKMGVVKHSNGECYWLILHKRHSNAFHAYSFCGNTYDSIIPVISNVGQIYSNDFIIRGNIFISSDGKKLAVTSHSFNYLDSIRLELFDFNATTGVISNQLIIPRGNYDDYTCIAFSPDSKKLYAGNGYSGNSVIYQFNLNAGSNSAIINSKTIIEYPVSGRSFIGMQLGLDGYIYIARNCYQNYLNEYLGVINNPNTLGTACNYVNNGVFLGGSNHLGKSLPFFVSSYLLPPIEFNYTNICLGDSVDFTLSDSVSTVYWDFGDTASGNFNYSNLAAPKHFYNSVGTYTVKAMCLHYGMHDTTTQIISIYVPPTVNLGQDTIIDSTTVLVLDAGAGFASYLWSTGDSTQTITINGANLGINTYPFSVIVTDTNGCKASDTILVIKGNVGLKELAKNSKITVYPNPTKGIFKITTTEINKDFQIKVYNIKGQEIQNRLIHQKENIVLDLSSKPKGIYFIRFWNARFVWVKKVVLQ